MEIPNFAPFFRIGNPGLAMGSSQDQPRSSWASRALGFHVKFHLQGGAKQRVIQQLHLVDMKNWTCLDVDSFRSWDDFVSHPINAVNSGNLFDLIQLLELFHPNTRWAHRSPSDISRG